MLVQNKFKKDDIISFRISTGEEIVAKLVTEDMTQYIVTRPLALIQTPKGIGLAPAMVTVDPKEDISYNNASIISIANPNKQIKDSYFKSVTGLVSGAGIDADSLKTKN